VGNISEALLLVDEPQPSVGGGPVPGFGQNAGITVCNATDANTSPLPASCNGFARQVNGYWVISSTSSGSAVAAANAYQGTVGTSSAGGGNTKLTFTNVPILATGAQNVQRVYRVANVRLTPGSAATITANVAVTPNANAVSTLNLANNAVTVATPQASLAASVTPVGGASLCAATALQPVGSQARANLAILSFKENFANAFKTRVLPLSNVAGAGQNGATTAQTNATGSYAISNTVSVNNGYSESGIVVQSLTVGTTPAGLASSGTRFKALFRGLPANATFYVSQTNVADYSTAAAAPTAIGDQTAVSYAIAIANGGGVNSGTLELVASTATPVTADAAGPANVAPGVAGVPVIKLVPDTNGNAEVVWEVVNVAPGSPETFNFAVYAVYNNVNNAPALGATGTVQLAYAPTSGNNSPGVTTSWIPRFTNPSAAQVNFFNVVPCQTTILFPFVTNQAGFETGLAISNTSKDPFNTTNTSGTCAMSFYGANQPSSAVTSSSVTSGTTFANTVTGMGLVNFQGYMIAVCNFQFAHGFAFVQGGTGTSQMAMGYLPLVMTQTSGRAGSLVGETLSQ